ncbi:LuxR family transcriptional regulator [Paraburkholderia bannensis]|nr:helix-turn-helix transcriptional regulator [Paraburkholderia bannensis]RQM47180.1 LuxR family transcriptional regulator [Paraburkholderia bannensis]
MLVEVSKFKESQEFALQTVNFARSMLNCSSAVFTWLDSHEQHLPHNQVGWPEETIKDYYSSFASADPLNVYRLIKQRATVATLKNAKRDDIHSSWSDYQRKHGLVDEVGFLFWAGDTPLACLSVIKRPGDSPFTTPDPFVQMYDYMQHSFLLLPSVKKILSDQVLRNDYFLTDRELGVASLMTAGMSNKDIAESLGIELATVKSHVIRILGKLGIDSRSQLAAFSADLAVPAAK